MRTIFRLAVLSLICGLSLSITVPVQAQPYAYVTNSSSNSVSVINAATNTVMPLSARALALFGDASGEGCRPKERKTTRMVIDAMKAAITPAAL